MRVIRLTVATTAALWTVGVVVGIILEFGKQKGARGTAQIFAGIFAVSACLLITIWLFQWAIHRQIPTDNETQDQSSENKIDESPFGPGD